MENQTIERLAGAPAGTHEGITNPALGEGLQDTLLNKGGGSTFVAELLPRLIGLALAVGAIVFLFIMLVGGIQWISSGGDKAAIESARGKIVNALGGVILLFATFAIVSFIGDFFGLKLLELDLGVLQLGN